MLQAHSIKAFVPAEDFELSRRFYTELGFTENWANEGLAEFSCGDARFLLQNFFEPQLAENLMMQLMVPDCEVWWAKLQTIDLTSYGKARAKAPELQPWGQKVSYLWDPGGVLWHIAEPIS
ncbi:MAG: VOC family protein [Pseudomonadales bacterium]